MNRRLPAHELVLLRHSVASSPELRAVERNRIVECLDELAELRGLVHQLGTATIEAAAIARQITPTAAMVKPGPKQ